MSSCMASHLPPPEKDGGGAAATASRNRLDLCRYLVRQAIEELDRGRRARRVVVLVALEEVDQPRLRHGHHGGSSPPQTTRSPPPPPPNRRKLFPTKGRRARP